MYPNAPTDSIDAYGGLGVSLDTSGAPFDSFLSKGLIHGYSSSRKLVSTAASAIRVRRDSDNAEQDIGFSSGELDTGSLTSFISTNSGFVRTIYDQVGNQDAGQSTTTAQQRIVNTGTIETLNSKTVSKYLGVTSTEQYSLTGITVSDYTIFVVYSALTVSNLSLILTSTSNSDSFFIRPDVGQVFNRVDFTNASVTTTAMTANQVYSYCVIKNSSTELNSFWRDNVSIGTQTVTQNDPTWTDICGYNHNAGFFELLIFDSVLDEADRNSINENMNIYYGI